jgi:hypothetical protein
MTILPCIKEMVRRDRAINWIAAARVSAEALALALAWRENHRDDVIS